MGFGGAFSETHKRTPNAPETHNAPKRTRNARKSGENRPQEKKKISNFDPKFDQSRIKNLVRLVVRFQKRTNAPETHKRTETHPKRTTHQKRTRNARKSGENRPQKKRKFQILIQNLTSPG